MTPEQIADRDSVWAQVAIEHPEFTHEHDVCDNYHAVREIVLGGSVTWAATHGYFKPCEGKLVMDIGANAGIFSTYCGIHGAKTIAFEPFKQVFDLFSKMIDKTGLADRVIPINAAVWTHNGRVKYMGHRTPNEDVTCYNGGLQTSGVKWTPEEDEKNPWVECLSLDNVIGDQMWDCVKWDVEGGEFEILLAASHQKLKQIKFGFVEFHDWASQSLYDETIKKLESIFTCKYFRAEASRGRYEAAWLWKK